MNKKNNKNSRRSKKGPGRQQAYNLLKPCLHARINTQQQVFAVNYATISNTYYSLLSSFATSPTLSIDILQKLLDSPEFIRNKPLYGFIRIKSVTLRAISSTNMNQVISDLPPLYLDLMLGSTLAITNPNNAYSSDSALEVKPNNSSMGVQQRKYTAPGVVIGLNGYPCLGTDLYIATTALTNTSQIDLVLGYGNAPTFNGATNTTTRVAVVEIIFDCEFSNPLFQTNA
jgi:hypothetical protein